MTSFASFANTSTAPSRDQHREIARMIDRQWPGAELIGCEYLAQGRINRLFRLRLQGAPVERAILRVRLMDDPAYRQGFASESWLTDLLRQHGFDASPALYACDDSRAFVAFDYSLIEEIDGVTLDLVVSAHAEPFAEAGRRLAQLHHIPAKWFGRYDAHTSAPAQMAVTYYRHFFEKVIDSFALRQPELAQAVRGVVARHFDEEAYRDAEPVLLHHDFHARNLLVEPDGRVVVIDWESARGGVRELDLVKWKYLTHLQATREQRAAFIRGYSEVLDFPVTRNFWLQELIWLIKMHLFETDWPTEDRAYFPDREFYLAGIGAMCRGLDERRAEHDRLLREGLSRDEEIRFLFEHSFLP